MIEAILYYLILADSIIANIFAWFYPDYYKKKYKNFAKRLPLTRWWTVWYLVLMLWIGFALYRLSILAY